MLFKTIQFNVLKVESKYKFIMGLYPLQNFFLKSETKVQFYNATQNL